MNSIEKENCLKERKIHIGGSEIGANPYRTALDVYLDKTSEGIVENISEAAYWGSTLEYVIAKEYYKLTGFDVEVSVGLIRHKEYKFIAANIDRWANGGGHILECKTVGFMNAHEWGEVGTDQIPESYKYQVAYYAAITGVERVDIAVLIGGQEFRIYQYLKAKEYFVIKEMEHLQIEVKNYMQNAELLIDNAGHLRAT